jgi:hypothetical protein
MKRAMLAIVAALALAGCESTRFEAPPVAEQSCDGALTGHWLSVGDSSGETGEMEMRIDAACRMQMTDHKPPNPNALLPVDKPQPPPPSRVWETTVLHVGHDGDRRYFWVDAAWANRVMELPPAGSPGDVYLLRYRVRGDRLVMQMPDTKAIAHRVIDNRLKGDVHQESDSLHVRLKAPVDPKALRARAFWDEDAFEFVRAKDAAP